MSGSELLASLRGVGETVAMIVVADPADAAERDHAVRGGAEAFFVRPYLDLLLVDAVWWAIEREMRSRQWKSRLRPLSGDRPSFGVQKD